MAAGSALVAAAFAMLAGAQDYAAAPPPVVSFQDGIVRLMANDAPRRLVTFPAGGPLERLTADPSLHYAVVEIPMSVDRPMLVLLGHAFQTDVRARLLDRPPWADPANAQPLSLEPRFDPLERQMIEGAWISLPFGSRPRSVYLLVETDSPREPGLTPLVAELYDPGLPAAYRSLARRWNGAAAADLASPLQARQRLDTQQVWPIAE